MTICLIIFSYVTVLSILVFSGIVLLPVLLPVAATDDNLNLERAIGLKNGKTPQNFTELEKLALGNVQVSGPSTRVYLHGLACYQFMTYMTIGIARHQYFAC
jgi:hypothetical protein